MNSPLLHLLLFLPLLAALVLSFVPSRYHNVFRVTALLIALAQVGLSSSLWLLYDWQFMTNEGVFQSLLLFEKRLPWITLQMGSFGSLHIDYHVGADFVAVLMVWMSSLVLLAATLSSWKIKVHIKGYFLLLLLLSTAVMGCFLSIDLFMFFLFFEFMLLPMYFLIGIWGGSDKAYASLKFFLYTLVGSLLILAVLVVLMVSATVVDPATLGGVKTFTLDYTVLTERSNYLPDAPIWSTEAVFMGLSIRTLAFWALLIGFLIKLPGVPFHTWLPDAHVQAPTPVSVLLAGILLKVGAFGILRLVFGIFPDQAVLFSPYIAWTGAIGILYGALVALAQDDLKKMIAYASVSHMGYVLIGFASGTPEGLSGAVYQMVSHGLLSALLFLIAGYVQEQTGTRSIASLSGLYHAMPRFTTVVSLTFFASLGMPGFSAFVAEFLVFLGAFAAATHPHGVFGFGIPLVALVGLVAGAGYFLWALQRMFFGEYWHVEGKLAATCKEPDLFHSMMWYPLLFFSILGGVFPSFWLEGLGPVAEWFAQMLHNGSLP